MGVGLDLRLRIRMYLYFALHLGDCLRIILRRSCCARFVNSQAQQPRPLRVSGRSSEVHRVCAPAAARRDLTMLNGGHGHATPGAFLDLSPRALRPKLLYSVGTHLASRP